MACRRAGKGIATASAVICTGAAEKTPSAGVRGRLPFLGPLPGTRTSLCIALCGVFALGARAFARRSRRTPSALAPKQAWIVGSISRVLQVGQTAESRSRGGWQREPPAASVRLPSGCVLPTCMFLYYVAISMMGPTLPSLQNHFELRASELGLAVAAFQLGAFVSGLGLSLLSDIFGRRLVLAASFLGVGVGFALQAAAVRNGLSFRVFLAMRAFIGVMSGSSPVIKAFIADTASAETLPLMMSYREAARTLSYVLGPALAGLVLSIGPVSGVLLMQSIAALLASLLVLLGLHDAAPKREASSLSKQVQAPSISAGAEDGGRRSAVAPMRGSWALVCVGIAISCVYNIGQSLFDAFFPVLCTNQLGLSPQSMCTILAELAFVVFVGAVAVYGPVSRRLGPGKTASLGLLGMAVGLLCIGLAPGITCCLAAAVLVAASVPLITPFVPALLATRAPPSRRGLALGIEAASNAVVRALAPVLLGYAYEAYGAAIAFSLGSFVVLAGGTILCATRL